MLLLASPFAAAQAPPREPADYVCPMDPDIRSARAGVCSRCGMKLVLGIPDGSEYPLELSVRPRVIRPGQPVELAFRALDPKSRKPVTKFEIVHERLFHMFVVSQDLKHFVHDHPVLGPDSVFRYTAVFPRPGIYRILGDFYPLGGTPQLIAKTLIVPGAPLGQPARVLAPDLGPRRGQNLGVELVMEPPQPIAGQKTLLFFKLSPSDGMEKYLGAWGHMLAASDDLIDLIHSHPFLADGGAHEQFNLIFPRARIYRIWLQVQRQGVVNTVAFNVPVSELR